MNDIIYRLMALFLPDGSGVNASPDVAGCKRGLSPSPNGQARALHPKSPLNQFQE